MFRCSPQDFPGECLPRGVGCRPLGDDGARLNEEFGDDGGQGKYASPQSASSPGPAVECSLARGVRFDRIPCVNEINGLTFGALR